jgi:hypothetical protein
MITEFDKFIYKLISEAQVEQPPSPDDDEGMDIGGDEGMGDDMGGDEDLSGDLGEEDIGMPEEKPVFPEELDLAKLAIRALYFNKDSKDVHNLKLRIDGREIPFEKISDYFEKTKKILPILQFVEWVMDKYEGLASKWTEQPEVKGKNIKSKIQYYTSLPEEQQLDNGKRVYWTRIILNALLKGSPSMNINIADVNEKNIVEVFRLLKQHFGHDTRGLSPQTDNLEGPGVF